MNVDGMDLLVGSMDSGVFFFAFDVVSGLLSGDSPATTNVRIAMEFHNQGSDLEERLTSGQQVCYLFFAFLFLEFFFDKTETGIYQVWWDCWAVSDSFAQRLKTDISKSKRASN